MARWGRSASFYRGRKVNIRGKGGLSTDVAQLEKMVREDFEQIMKSHIVMLQQTASDIHGDAEMLVQKDTGELSSSIEVRVSKSYRYPGIIAHASSKDKGFDYAVVQEEDETFSHNDDESAHYLGGPFALHISEFYEDATGGKELQLPVNLEHAKEYIL